MKDEKSAGFSATSGRNESGVSNNIAGSGNIIANQVHSAPGKFVAIVIPILAAVISGVGGAYAARVFTINNASTAAEKQAENLVGVMKETINLAKSTGSSPQLIIQLEELAAQVNAIQASMQLTKISNPSVDAQADFWLPQGRAVILGGVASYSVLERYKSGRLKVKLNNDDSLIEAGSQLEYKNSRGIDCKVVYVSESADQKLFGFRNMCD